MYLFLLYLVVYCVIGVDLSDPSRFDAYDEAAETAKLINFVNKADNFKVIFISGSTYDDVKEDEDDTRIFESIKLLQKTYDTYRKFNDFIDEANVQYISNPEVLEDYKNLPKVRSEPHDIFNDQVSIENSPLGKSNRDNINSSQQMKNFRKHNNRKAINLEIETSDSDTSNSDDNDAADEIEASNIQNNREETQDEDHLETEPDSKDTKDMQKLNETKPIIEPISLEKGRNPKTGSDSNVLIKVLLPEEESRSKNESTTVNNSKENWNSQNKPDIINKRFKISSKTTAKDTKNLSSNEQKSDQNRNILLKEQISKDENNSKGDRHRLTMRNTSMSKKYLIDSTIPTESFESEEIESNMDKTVQNEGIDIPSNDRKSKLNKRQNNHRLDNTETKNEKYFGKSEENENKRKFVSNNFDSKVSMNEQVMDWNDEKNEKNKHASEFNYEKFEKETNKRKKDNEWGKPDTDKNINIRENYDSEERPKTSKIQKSDDWNKKNDDWDKKLDNYDETSNNRNNKYNSRNKKDDNWNRKDDTWSNSEERVLNKKEDSWNKKGYDKRNKRHENDDFERDDTPKKHSVSYNMETNEKDNSGWGNYDLFKSLRDKKNSKETGNVGQETVKPIRLNIRSSKLKSWENYAPKRDDYYEKPKQFLRTFAGTAIPMVGKRPVYD